MNVAPVVGADGRDTLYLHVLVNARIGDAEAEVHRADAHWLAMDPVPIRALHVPKSTETGEHDAWEERVIPIAVDSGSSGNRLLVLRSSGVNEVLLSRRYLVAEHGARLTIVASSSLPAADKPIAQGIDIDVHLGELTIEDAFSQVEVVVLPGLQWDLAQRARPSVVKGAEIDLPRPAARFNGGNEWRTIDLTEPHAGVDGVLSVGSDPDGEIVTLLPDERRSIKRYEEQQDHNGNFVPQASRAGARMIRVKWCLALESPIADGALHVVGGFTDRKCLPEFRCTWDPAHHCYTATGLVPRGRLDYAYALQHAGSEIPDLDFMEGSHARTENDLLALIYWKDRLIAAQGWNTHRGNTFVLSGDR